MEDRLTTDDHADGTLGSGSEPLGEARRGCQLQDQRRIDGLGRAVRAISGPLRWTPQRKIALLTDVRTGRMAIETACQRFNLTVEEIGQWTADFDRLGIDGVKATLKNPQDTRLDSGASEETHVAPRPIRRAAAFKRPSRRPESRAP